MRTNDASVVARTSGLTKRYADLVAVDQLDLTVRRGEIYGFLGPNGAGKTTTLGMLTDLVRPSGGSISLFGVRPSDPIARAGTGSLIELPACYPYLSGRDNLRVFARYAEAARNRVDEVLELVELADRAGDRFSTYSLGMKQRLGVAIALLKEPELVILDEPTNGLDPAGMRDMRELVSRLGESGHTVILSSHLLGEVQQVCDRIGIINAGRMVAEYDVAELADDRELVVAAEPIEAAERHVVGHFDGVDVRRDGDLLRLSAEPGRAAEINRSLVEAGISVSELRSVDRGLEELFFDLTDESRTPKERADVR